MVREFYLENEFGIRWNLNYLNNGFLVFPKGLGYNRDASYVAIGNSFIRNYMREEQQQITATIIFGTTAPYRICSKFLNYANSAEQLKLLYVTDAGEYYRNVDLVEIEKTEITKEGVLECPVVFICRGLFYSNQVERFVISRSDGEVRWDFAWPARFNDYGSRKVTVDNTGHVPAGLQLELYGYCENPTVIVSKNGSELYRVVFPVTLQQDEKILYSSMDGDLHCIRVGENGAEENLINLLDIQNTNFFKFPVGSSQVEFTSDTGATNRTVMTVYRFFRMV